MASRSPQQTLMVMTVVLAGIWIGWTFMRQERERDKQALETELPDIELVGLSPEELYAHDGFKPHTGMPESWDDIHLRLYAEPDGIYLKFLRCTIDAEEVEATNPAAFKDGMYRRREADELPPSWWPGGAGEVAPAWAVPDWWNPARSRGVGTWWAVPDRDTVIGVYLHYDPGTRLLHYWEWRRGQDAVRPPAGYVDQPVVDRVASALATDLAREGHPVVHGDWLEAVELRGSRLTGLLPGLEAAPEQVDALLRPKRAMRYLLALRGIDRPTAEALLRDLPMRAGTDDAPPPAADWGFALPQVDGAGELPGWFAPGPGPRWHYELRRPGSGTLDEARWAAYDAAAQTLYVWDWRNREEP